MKYKIVAIINILLGVFQIGNAFSMLLFVIPTLADLYSQFDSAEGPDFAMGYGAVAILLIIGTINLVFAYKLLKEKGTKKDKYFMYSVIYLVVTFFISGILSGLMTLAAINPIYNLTNAI